MFDFISKSTSDFIVKYNYHTNTIKINTKNGENIGSIHIKNTSKKMSKVDTTNLITIYFILSTKRFPFLHKLAEFIIEELSTPKIHREINTKIDSNQYHYNEKYDISFYKENLEQLINIVNNLSIEKFIILNTANKFNL